MVESCYVANNVSPQSKYSSLSAIGIRILRISRCVRVCVCEHDEKISSRKISCARRRKKQPPKMACYANRYRRRRCARNCNRKRISNVYTYTQTHTLTNNGRRTRCVQCNRATSAQRAHVHDNTQYTVHKRARDECTFSCCGCCSCWLCQCAGADKCAPERYANDMSGLRILRHPTATQNMCERMHWQLAGVLDSNRVMQMCGVRLVSVCAGGSRVPRTHTLNIITHATVTV